MAYFCSATLVQFYNAIDTLGIKSRKPEFSGKWHWSLPDKECHEDAHQKAKVIIKKNEHLGDKMSAFDEQPVQDVLDLEVEL